MVLKTTYDDLLDSKMVCTVTGPKAIKCNIGDNYVASYAQCQLTAYTVQGYPYVYRDMVGYTSYIEPDLSGYN